LLGKMALLALMAYSGQDVMLASPSLFRLKDVREISKLPSWPMERKQIASKLYEILSFSREICEIIAGYLGSCLMRTLNLIGRKYDNPDWYDADDVRKRDEALSEIVNDIRFSKNPRRRRRSIRRLIVAIAKLANLPIPAHPIRAMAEIDEEVKKLYPKPNQFMYDEGDEDELEYKPEDYFDPYNNPEVIAAYHTIILLVWPLGEGS
jgi:hypothetical protein